MGVASQYGNRSTSGNGAGGSITASAKKGEGEAFVWVRGREELPLSVDRNRTGVLLR